MYIYVYVYVYVYVYICNIIWASWWLLWRSISVTHRALFNSGGAQGAPLQSAVQREAPAVKRDWLNFGWVVKYCIFWLYVINYM